MSRPLPTAREAAAILAAKRTRPTRRPPPPPRASLGSIIKALDARFGEGVGGLVARWREIVGEPLARASEPSRLIRSRSGGSSLEIRVDGPAAALVQHQAPQILERANLFLGAGAVVRLRIVQGPVHPRTGARSPPRSRRQRPLDAAQEAALETSLASLEKDDLRRALLRLGRHVVRRQEQH
jgi:hypothetical protein